MKARIAVFSLLIIIVPSIYFAINYKPHQHDHSFNQSDARLKIEKTFNLYSSITYTELESSLKKLEVVLIEQGYLEDNSAKSYVEIIANIDRVKGRVSDEEKKTIPNYYELRTPSIMANFVTASYHSMIEDECKCYVKITTELKKYLDRDEDFTFSETINFINDNSLEGEIARNFLLFTILQNF
ncbi:MAG: hypothetical protein RIE86_09425 [Imperialibacter sp.]|uniref:hypothetical protein n=1 Tax=Imperialibacter sp. TaxID=2038411 RepID=UPI0032EB5452